MAGTNLVWKESAYLKKRGGKTSRNDLFRAILKTFAFCPSRVYVPTHKWNTCLHVSVYSRYCTRSGRPVTSLWGRERPTPNAITNALSLFLRPPYVLTLIGRLLGDNTGRPSLPSPSIQRGHTGACPLLYGLSTKLGISEIATKTFIRIYIITW